VTECDECGERAAGSGRQNKRKMKRVEKDTSVINAVPEGKQLGWKDVLEFEKY